MRVSHLPSLTAWPTFPALEVFKGHDVRCTDLFFKVVGSRGGGGGLVKFVGFLCNPVSNFNLNLCYSIPGGGKHPSEGGGNAGEQFLFAWGQSTTAVPPHASGTLPSVYRYK